MSARHPGVVSELSEFLRARRERLRPSDVGLPDHGRRRTPGLRREEVAALAGVSVDYLVRLEQGRDSNPSPSVLAALASALRLTDVEKAHLGMLALRDANPGLCPSITASGGEVAPSVRVILDRIEPTPAYVSGPYGDVLAWTAAWEALVLPLRMLDHETPNEARYLFLDPAARAAYPEWEALADRQVAQLRTASIRWDFDERFVALLHELTEVPDFASRWSAHEVATEPSGERTVVHPDAGTLRVIEEVMRMSGEDDQRLVIWLPADHQTELALDALVGSSPPSSPATLRLVGD